MTFSEEIYIVQDFLVNGLINEKIFDELKKWISSTWSALYRSNYQILLPVCT